MRRAAGHRNNGRSRLVALILFLASVALPANPSSNAAEAADRINVYLCKSATATVTPWRNTVSASIGEVLLLATGLPARVMGEAECGAAAVDIACTAGVYDEVGPTLICSPDTLLVLVRMVAWYVLGATPDEGYDAFRDRQPERLALLAMQSAMDSSDEPFERDLDILRVAAEATAAGGLSHEDLVTFRLALGLVFGIVFGHEGGHLLEMPPYCAIADQSAVESSGLWQTILRVAGSDELFERQDLLLNEIRADRCAARVIHETLGSMGGDAAGKEIAFARHVAADIVAALAFARPLRAAQAPVVANEKGYLYPPLRIIALSTDLSLLTGSAKICGGAAEILVQATQMAFEAHPGDGMMPDEIEGIFPTAVIDAWESRRSWSPELYRCEPTAP